MSQLKETNQALKRFKNVYFVGIGGAGMSGIAEVMLNLGFQISGSDLTTNDATNRLKEQGATIYVEHRAEQVADQDVVVYSSAIDPCNAEIQNAKLLRIPVIPRAEMLGELMRFRRGIGVAGTHGKTTTTSLVASVLAEGGLDPTYVIGGLLNSSGRHAKLGDGRYLVAEADESDGSFLLLQPTIAVITNIDADHLQTYDGSLKKLVTAFESFLHHLPFYGLAILCTDDPVVAELHSQAARSVLSYGIDSDADIKARNLKQSGKQMEFEVRMPGQDAWEIMVLNMPGKHNVLNALAAIAIGWELGVSVERMRYALEEFKGIGRRFDVCEINDSNLKFTLIDDYAHHPTEIATTIDAAKKGWPNQRLIVVFQPHRYSRTSELFEDFSDVLSTSDVLILSEVYSAGEAKIDGADGRSLARSIRNRRLVDPIFVESIDALYASLGTLINEGDLVLLMGAGSIGGVAKQLRQKGLGAVND